MNKAMVLVTILVVVGIVGLSTAMPEPAPQISWGCTFSCARWNYCIIQNLSDPGKCGAEPSGCRCTSFAWEG